jgi:carboxyl-terminal processing protease
MIKTLASTVLVCFGLAACSGGGGNPGACLGSAAVCSPSTSSTGGAPSTALPGPVGEAKFAASSTYAQQCVAPRPAGSVDPYTQAVYNDKTGSLTTELQWIRSFVNETYLWYDEVPAIDLAGYKIGATVDYYTPADNIRSQRTLAAATDVTEAFFNSQRTPATTASGKPKDQFHFIYPTPEWNALSAAGASVGYGFEPAVISTRPPRKFLVAYTAPNSQATANLLARGTEFLTVNGSDIVNGSDVATINEGLFSPVPGKSYIFGVRDVGASTIRTVTMTAGPVTSTPVQNVRVLPTASGDVGYMLFNDHIATAESQLVDAVNQLKAANAGAGVSDLVLDIRYNGGGYLDIASELAYMIAGSAATSGKVFDGLTVNRKNPFGPNQPGSTPFLSTASGFSVAAGTSLPQLNLPRVFVLTGAGTCSASESIINGLRGAGVQVIQIGATTCGKPYGFYPQENCGTTYFTIQFKGVNNAGFGDYADGFIPAGSGTTANNLPGCAVPDDFTKPLGDPAEGRLAAALKYRIDGTCPVVLASKRAGGVKADAEPVLVRSPLRENRWLGGRRPG